MQNYNEPLVSVVIPCYNHEQFVKHSIQSVIDQTYHNIELIIIDDGSRDSSVLRIQEMVKECEQRFVKFEFRSRLNKGLSATLNESLDWSQGKYYVPFASDDIMIKNRIKKQVDIMEVSKDIAVICGSAILIDECNYKIGELKIQDFCTYSFSEIIMLQHKCYAPTQLIRSNFIREIGGYKDEIIIEDWYMLLKLSEKGRVLVSPDFYSYYRQHDSNTMKKFLNIHKGRLEVLQCFKNEINYATAYYNIVWANNRELVLYCEDNKFIFFIKMFVLSPRKFISRILFKLKRSFT